MKILMVSMNSMHFRRWTEQLRDSEHELFWFDVLDQGFIPSMSWMHQITGWKKGFLKKHGRVFFKKNVPWIYQKLSDKYDVSVSTAFAKAVKEIQPEVVHSFTLHLGCIPILEVMKKKTDLWWIYSSWGSDLFMPSAVGVSKVQIQKVLERIQFLITDCKRDYKIAVSHGFSNKFFGVFPGNGGTDYPALANFDRDGIVIKAYQDEIGRGDHIAQSILSMPDFFMNIPIYFIGASQNKIYKQFANWPLVKVFKRENSIGQEALFSIFQRCFLYIAYSISDGLPNMLLEALGFGLFPIQSNPGHVMNEIIEDRNNGILFDINITEKNLCDLIVEGVLLKHSILKNIDDQSSYFTERYSRSYWKPKINELYDNVGKI